MTDIDPRSQFPKSLLVRDVLVECDGHYEINHNPPMEVAMEQSKYIEALRDVIAEREDEVNAQLQACENRLLDANLQIQAYALRGDEPRFGLSLQWKEHNGEWLLSIRRKANICRWSEASIEDRTYAIKLIDPLLKKLVENAAHFADAIGARVIEQ